MVLINKIALVFIAFFNSNLFAFSLENLEFNRNEQQYYIEISPVLFAGTHVNGMGINTQAGLRLNHRLKEKVISSCLSVHFYPDIYVRYYGIPGNPFQLNTGASYSLTFGKRIDLVNNSWVRTELARHTIKYFFSYYLSSDKTNQPYGGIEYKLNLKNSIFRIRLDNDDCYFLATDKYRSTFGEIEFLHYNTENVYGINTSFYIWTGNLDGTASTNSPNAQDNTYALTGYGGDYSHGILSLGFVYNFLRLSIGYDSEEIRNKIQNGWHHFYNRPKVPLLNRSNRFYFQVSIFNSELQY